MPAEPIAPAPNDTAADAAAEQERIAEQERAAEQAAIQRQQQGRGPQSRPDVRSALEDAEPSALVTAAANGARLQPEQAQDALEWLLDDTDEDEGDLTHTLEINVGGPAKDDGTSDDPRRPVRWIKWVIEPVDEGVIRKILNNAGDGGGGRRRRRQGQSTEAGSQGADANLKIIVAGTVDPDLTVAAQTKNIADPSLIVRMRFKKKPGLLGQIADAIMELSGFNNEDVRDGREAAAAGN